jgi:hypothetical protein
VPAGVKFNSGKISIGGNLSDASGNPLGASIPDTLDMTIRLMNRDTGGVSLYTERFLKVNSQSIIVSKGAFAANLGNGSTTDNLLQTVSMNPHLWVEIIIEDASPDTLRPRRPLSASPQALVATGNDALHGGGDPNSLNVNAVFGKYYINDADNSTWIKINVGWKRMD